MNVYVSVVGQRLKVPSNFRKIISGSKRFIKLTFMLDSDWDGLISYARFKQGNTVYESTLDSSNSCYIPSGLTSGSCTLMLYGLDGTGDNIIATTNDYIFTVVASSYEPADSGGGDGEDYYDESYIATTSEVEDYLGI